MGTEQVSQLSLPPGFRFYPTDEELLVHYLCRKVAGHHFSLQIIGDIDLYKFDPWVLPSKATFGEKEWYFFSPRDRKYPRGSRPNRVAGSGYWKATGTDKIITTEGRKVGIKKALVFYIGKAPKGNKTNWIMHEYRLSEPTRKTGSSRLDDWVLCRIYKKNSSIQKPDLSVSTKEHSNVSFSSSSSHLEDVLESLPEIDDRFFALPRMNSLKTLQEEEKLNFQNLSSLNNLAVVGSFTELICNGQAQAQAHRAVSEMNFPAIPPLSNMDSPSEKFGSSLEEEVESGLRSQGVENSGFFQQDSNAFTQSFFNSIDPFGIRYPTHQGGFGYRQ
ncbi:hypothetical protein HHK36_005396 [Tetracentron sinense]|uniref:NAC domain-containing protein n=1 Tax=Tetracentron sinense TaxID=13715 RepID=A0A835DR01_TETSI|nr:hypothetical protein HHK36_005396 [Tetracentron sinense]